MVNLGSEAVPVRSRGVQSVDIAVRLLQVIAAAPGPLSLKDVSDAAGMPPSKAHRYLASFVAAGLVTQKHRSGAYDLGRAALRLGLAAMARLDIVNDAASAMEDLVERSGATALLAVWAQSRPDHRALGARTELRRYRPWSWHHHAVDELGDGTGLPGSPAGTHDRIRAGGAGRPVSCARQHGHAKGDR